MQISRRRFLQGGAFGLSIPLLSGLKYLSPVVSKQSGIKSFSPSDATAPNVVFLMVDALRPDHLPFNGYARDTTPNLNTWIAQEGVRFTNTFTTAPWTYPANASILSGLLPSTVDASWDFSTNPVDEQVPLLAEYLQSAGYKTAGFVTPTVLQKKYGLGRGFDHFDDSLATRPTSNKGTAAEVNKLALDWLQANQGVGTTQPFFLYLYYFDPHSWYNAPSPYDTKYDPSYTGDLTPAVYADGQDVVEGRLKLSARDVEHLVALYDGEISYWDNEFGKLMTQLEQQGLLQNTLFVICSDHGEMFGEHDRWTHGSMLYDEVLRVTMLMRYDGVISKGSVITHEVQNMDLMPTLLDYANIPVPDGLHAISLRNLIENPQQEYQRTIFSEVGGNTSFWFAPDQPLYAVRENGWKLIRQFDDSLQPQLFQPKDVSIFEEIDEISNHPEIADQLGETLNTQFFPYRLALPAISK